MDKLDGCLSLTSSNFRENKRDILKQFLQGKLIIWLDIFWSNL